MSNHDFIPERDETFDGWQSNFVSTVTANLAPFGILITDPDYVDLLAKQTDWTAKWAVGKKTANPTHPMVVAKQNSRHAYEKVVRLFNKRHLVFNGAVSDADKAALGTHINDTIRTRTLPIPYQPDIKIEEIGHLFQVLHFKDPNATGRALPEGATAILVFRAILPASTGGSPAESDFHYAGKTGTFSFTSNFDLTDVDKVAYYYALYENVHGENSPKSLIINAPVA